MFTESGKWTIEASVNEQIDKNDAWGDCAALFIQIGSESSTFGWKPEPVKIVQSSPGEEKYRIAGPNNDETEFDDLKGLPIPPANLDGKMIDIIEHHSITVTGQWRYFTQLGDFRGNPTTPVPAKFCCVELRDINDAIIGYGYTDANGNFSIPGINPNNGIKARLFACINYSGDELRVVYQGNSLSGLQDVWHSVYSAIYMFPDDGGNHTIGTNDYPQGTDGDGAFWIKDDLDRAYRFPASPTSPGPCTVRWTETLAEGTGYNGSQVVINGGDEKSSDIVIHEIAHNFMRNKYGFSIPLDYGPDGGHSIESAGDDPVPAENQKVAWVEGWAEFYPLVVNGNSDWTSENGSLLNLENPTWGTQGWGIGDTTEGRVAGSLWDIYDINNDGYDQYNTQFSNIWDTFYQHPVDVFINYWDQLKLNFLADQFTPARALYQNTIIVPEFRWLLTAAIIPQPPQYPGCIINQDTQLLQPAECFYTTGQQVNLTAHDYVGYHFSNWTDGVGNVLSTQNTYQFTMDSDKTVHANFMYSRTLTMSVNNLSMGSTTPTVGDHNYDSGTPVTIKADASPGYHFVSWTGDISDIEDPGSKITTIHMNGSYSIQANFAQNSGTPPTVVTNPATFIGTTTASLNGELINSGSTGAANLSFEFWPESDPANITTVAGNPPTLHLDDNFYSNITQLNPGIKYYFKAVADGGVSGVTYGDPPQWFITSGGTTYTLTYTAGAHGSISGTTPQTVAQGGSGTAVTAQANTGYHFVNWSDSSTANPRTDTNVTANISVTANFAPDSSTYTLTTSTGSGGTVTTPGVGSFGPYNSGQVVNLVATPNANYHFVNWTGNTGTINNPNAASSTITMNGNYSITANFAQDSGTTYTLTYTAGANGSISGTTPQTVVQGGSGTPVTAVANPSYHFVNWSDSSTANPRTDSNVTADISVTANFAQDSGTPPSISTGYAANITTNSAILQGNLTDKGSASTVTVSFQYGTSSGNYPYETSSQQKSSTGTFAIYVVGLNPGTTYYFCAKAVGDGTPSYGGEQSFSTQPPTPPGAPVLHPFGWVATQTSVTIYGLLDSLGSATQVYLYFEYGTTTAYGNTVNANPPFLTVSSIFAADGISGLLPGTTYHFRIKAVGNGTVYTSDEVFTTLPSLPSVTTNAASNITSTTARLNGAITNNGGENPTVHIYWGLTDGGTTAGNWAHDINLGTLPVGTFYSDISGLTASTTYYYRCYVTNSSGSSWDASSATFTTAAPPVAPTITNSTGAGNVLDTSARLNGEITNNGNENPTVHIYWGPTDGGTTAGNWAHDINLGVKPVGTFYSDISGLTPSTSYYYRCYASNSAGSSWAASSASFTTTATSVKLIGVDTSNPSSGSYSANRFVLYRFQATTTGNMTTFKFKASGSGNVKVAIYSDNAGAPGTLLSAMNTSTAVVAGWNDIAIPSTALVSGTYYWLAYTSDAAIGYYQSTTGTMRYKSITYSSFTFPSSAGSGFSSSTSRVGLLAGWGFETTQNPIAPTVTNSTGASNVLDTTARLNGELTNNGNENPTVHIYWGDNDGGTTAGNWDHDISLGTLPVGTFYSDISGLTASTAYYYRCYAINSAGGSWSGSSANFTTLAPPVTPATVTNSIGASNISNATATLNGELTNNGNENPTVHIYWGLTDGGTTAGNWAHDINLGTLPVGTFYSDISGLTPSTSYYYRCYASNSAGGSWAASSASFTTTATSVKLIGVDASNPSSGSYSANRFVLYRFQATTTGNMTTFKFKASGSGHVKVAIYSDNAGEPGTLLSAVNTSTAVVTGWNSVSIPSTALVSGTYYWLSYTSDAAIGYYQSATGTMRYKTNTYSTFSFPASAGTGFTSSTTRIGLLAGWGW